jgi:hypothetical protein
MLKLVTWIVDDNDALNSNVRSHWVVVGYWNADTNPITGITLGADVGIVSGTCSLYGYN